jgi:drug/metabolite transporter (DMT)-like permease
MSGNAVVYLALMSSQLMNSGYHIFSKIALNSNAISPIMLCFVREVMATPLLFLFLGAMTFLVPQHFHEKPLLPERKDLLRFVALGFGGIFANQVLFLLGLQYTSPTNASITQPLIPIFTAILSLILGYEKLSKFKTIGILSAVGGAVIMMAFSGEDAKSSGQPMKNALLGNVVLMLNCFGYACFIILQRPISSKYNPVMLTAWAYLFGSVFVTALASPYWIKQQNWIAIGENPWVIGAISYAAMFSSAIVLMIATWANSRVQGMVTTVFSAAQPFWTTVLAVIFLKSVITVYEIIGAVLIISGLLLVCYAKDKEMKQLQKEQQETVISSPTEVVQSPTEQSPLLQ